VTNPVALVLASRSPRRRQMLEEAGFVVRVMLPDLDDGVLRPGRVTPAQWVMALAYLKARCVCDQLIEADVSSASPTVILAADTVCVVDEEILGQPRDEEHARLMLRAMRNRDHQTITGACLFHRDGRRWRHRHLVDSATVRIGEITDAELADYLRSEEWRGKAGGYNLSERIAEGWPIECLGDPATVMGLPMRMLTPILRPGV